MSKGANARLVQNSTNFCSVARDCLEEVSVLHVSQDEISKLIRDENPWETVKDAPGVSKMHLLRCYNGFCEMFHTEIDPVSYFSLVYDVAQTPTFKVGEWVIVA